MFSWLINTFIGNVPTWIWPAGAGAATLLFFMAGILSHIPEAKPYAIFIKPVSFIAIILCVFMYGGAGVVAVMQAQLQIMEAKVDEAQKASQIANTQIHTVYVDRVKTVHDTKVVVQKEIQQVEKLIDKECKVDPQAVQILNDAAKGGSR
jgi:hypothetical protein